MNLENARFIIASGPVIIENDKVLLNRHGEDEKAKQYWKFVGGRVKDFEVGKESDALEMACLREVKEEMGIDVEILMSIKPMLIKHPDKPNTAVVLIHYLAKRKGEVRQGSDIEEWKWFPVDELPEHCAPNIRPVIDEYKRLKAIKIIA